VNTAVKIAVVGAGPSGIYAADALLKQADVDIEIDILDRLPTPYGLVRYGVAPDHPNIKSVVRVLQRVLESPRVRFLGCVEFGVDITRDQVKTSYDAIVYASGASVDRPLGVPGESLHGSFPATEFVAWYSGHPDGQVPVALDDIESVAVIGVGNVAIDVARILAKSADSLAKTDVPANVLATLRASTVKDIHIIGRRSAEYAKFTSKELRELGELANATVHVRADEVATGSSSHDRATATKP
jgi:ferredoxin--NADP+ reductase